MLVDTVPDARRFYSAADVSIAPSTTENLGSAAEASAMGVPTIASRTGGFPEIVIPGYSGWLADVGDVEGFTCSLDRRHPTASATAASLEYGVRATRSQRSAVPRGLGGKTGL